MRPVRRSSSPLILRALATLFTLALLAASSPAAAQDDDIVQPDKLQFDLYQQGAEAYKGGDYKKAIELFEASLAIGKLNITYLNLGRAFFKIGQCDKASEAYAKARSSPKIANPTPMQILQKIEQYVAELPSACPAYLTLTCAPEGLQIFVDGQGPSTCSDKITLLPGDHTIRAEKDGESAEEKVSVKGMDKVNIDFKIEALLAKAGGGGNGNGGKGNGDIGGVVPPERGPPSFYAGVSLGFIANGSTDIQSNNGSRTEPTQDDSSNLALDLVGAFRVFSTFYVGPRIGIVPSFKLTDPNNNGRDFPISGSQFSLNLMALYMLPLGDIAPYAMVDGGFNVVSPDDANFSNLTGGNFGLGGGVRWSFTDALALTADVRFSRYTAQSDDVTGGGQNVNITGGDGGGVDIGQQTPPITDALLEGTRLTLNIGVNLDF